MNIDFIKGLRTNCADAVCDTDWIEIRSYSHDIGGPRYCCDSRKFKITSNSNDTIILFYSISSNKIYQGFQATITFPQSKKIKKLYQKPI